MDVSINIPSVEQDERIGSAFNHLFQVISQTTNSQGEDIEWNLRNTSFFHPFFLAPLVIYKQGCGKNIQCINHANRLSGYLKLVHFEVPLFIAEGMDIEAMLTPYIDKTYIPVCQFELCKSNIDGFQSILQQIIKRQSHADARIITPLSYMLGELIDNMNEHSYGRYGYVFSQYLKQEGAINLVLADDGITIMGSYCKFNLYADEINGNEAEALKLANEGRSTKNLPHVENRGYGLSSTKSMLVDGLKGAFFMLSGRAFHRHDTNGSVYVKLPPTINWDGTIILMRIPINVPAGFNYELYIK